MNLSIVEFENMVRDSEVVAPLNVYDSNGDHSAIRLPNMELVGLPRNLEGYRELSVRGYEDVVLLYKKSL